MNKDIRIAVGLTSHPKTIKLMRRCGDRAFFCLLTLWGWAAQYRPDGDLCGMDAESIEIAAGWTGEDGVFVSQLVAVKFMDGEEGSWTLHDWATHNAWAAKADERSDSARLSRLARVNPEKAQELKSAGRTGVTQDEYAEYTTVVRPLNDRTTDRSTLALALNPALNPALDPKTVEKAQEKGISPLTPRSRGEATGEGNSADSPADSPADSKKPKAPRAPKPIVYSDSFEEFWAAYPRPIGKDKAFESWNAVPKKHPGIKPPQITAAIRAQVEANQFVGNDGVTEFTPLPATWLNQGRWADPILPKRRGTGSTVTDQNMRAAQEFVNMVGG